MYDPAQLYQDPILTNMSVGPKPPKPKLPPHPTDHKGGMNHPGAAK